MRFRLHVSRGRAGFYREGTHQLCDPAATGQLSEGSVARVERLVAVVEEAGPRASSVEVTENISGDERAMSMAVDDVASMGVESVSRAVVENGLTGCVVHDQSQRRVVAGDPRVSDSLALLTGGRATAGSLTRHAESFFQGNRFLIADLAGAVLDAMPDSGDVLDLYAGVGLFAVALAAQGRRVTAIEGDPSSGADLQANAAPYNDRLTVRVDSVERAAGRQARGVSTVVLDPPRTGLSPEALTAVAGTRADRVVYVSCDPATMARDARRLLDAGFMLTTLRAFDLFPNTPHIECVGVFDRGAQRSASL
jgi:23S rRNA (uracil1939-C5)-methyltransferase